jgi:hypothetical protein
LLLGACATEPRQFWIRTDGRPVIARQFEVDSTICRGDAQKANASGVVITGGGLAGAAAAANHFQAVTDVYTGCMANHGYLVKAECPPTANGDCVPTLRPGENYQFPR